MNETHWLLLTDDKKHPYHLIRSQRAKYLRIKLSPQGELSVVLPRGVALKHAHAFLHSRRGWVEKHLQSLPEPRENKRPDQLHLALLNETWTVDYVETPAQSIELQEIGDARLSISGKVHDLALIREVIVMWCKQKARETFHALLQDCAEAHGFHYRRLSIRAQKTRWGSCSSDKNINLNCKLLFMTPEIVRYVMVHELCHTIEMNHSRRFWALVEECDPDYKHHRKQLKVLAKTIPI